MSKIQPSDTHSKSVQTISVIVPDNPFVSGELGAVKHCLAALDVVKLMEWWPGNPHSPHRDASKVTTIQRSLDWKRVVHIAAYLLQREILDVASTLDEIFRPIYEPRKHEPGREWPPRVPKVVGFEPSDYPTFSNILLHVNGAELVPAGGSTSLRAQNLVFNEKDKKLNFSVIDGQHRINGAFLAVKLLSKQVKTKTIGVTH